MCEGKTIIVVRVWEGRVSFYLPSENGRLRWEFDFKRRAEVRERILELFFHEFNATLEYGWLAFLVDNQLIKALKSLSEFDFRGIKAPKFKNFWEAYRHFKPKLILKRLT